jgi:integrase
MPVYRKGKKWRVVVFLRGERRDWVIEGSKADAVAFEARERAKAEAGESERRVVPTFAEFCAREYAPHAQAHLKPSTWRNREYQIAILVEHFGDLKLNIIGTGHVEGFKATRAADKISPGTINDDIKVLRAVLSYARDLGYPAPMPKVKALPVRTRRHAEAWSDAEIERLLAAVTDRYPAILPMVVFLLNTGCRKGEALALQWENVDMATGVIGIAPSEEWQPKNGKARQVPISPALRPWLAFIERRTGYVFPNRSSKPYASWPKKQFDDAVAKAGLKGGPHRLRHTYATKFLAARPDLFLLGQILGHSHSRVTELYGHLVPDQIAAAGKVVQFAADIGPAALHAKVVWLKSEVGKRASSGQGSVGSAGNSRPLRDATGE